MQARKRGTERVVGLTKELDGVRAVILDVTLLQSRSAVHRREREGDIATADAERILKQIEEDASLSFLVQPSTSAVIEEAARLIDEYLLRTYDALQLAGCLVVRQGLPGPLTFVCADTRLCEAAALEGLLACISHHPTVEARDTTARTSLRLLAVLDVLFKYACARQAAHASS